ncbi:MAG TPA: single-stranded DNA-binding protein [Alphaproteobacteria bacterium]|nr:single-stranded DNA-binding protein [Rhodospirillaceae bacterium]HRJ12295.1 single-stranded DNA-binding protein [Alphaproteobacteria bacterium]
MAGSLNKVTIIGNVGKEPEIRSFQNGDRVASFSVATSERWKDKASGEQKERTEWHRISILNQSLVGVVEKYVKKGTKLYLEGQLETRKWTDKDGQDKYSTEVVLRPYRGELLMLDRAGSGEGMGNDNYSQSSYQATGTDGGSASIPADFDDEIPF